MRMFDHKTLTTIKTTITTNKQRAIIATAGLALFGGLAAGGITDTTHTPTPTPTVQQTTSTTPTTQALMPTGEPTNQTSFTPTAEQKANAEQIIQTGEQMNLPPRAQVIAVATSLQETHLNNYGHLGDTNDHDSLGLFQQRPSSGWGSPDQLTDPDYASHAFYTQLKDVPGYDTMPLTDAAQTVQVSAYPHAYAKWEKMAADLVNQHHTK